jgi:hypothetical protein
MKIFVDDSVALITIHIRNSLISSTNSRRTLDHKLCSVPFHNVLMVCVCKLYRCGWSENQWQGWGERVCCCVAEKTIAISGPKSSEQWIFDLYSTNTPTLRIVAHFLELAYIFGESGLFFCTPARIPLDRPVDPYRWSRMRDLVLYSLLHPTTLSPHHRIALNRTRPNFLARSALLLLSPYSV